MEGQARNSQLSQRAKQSKRHQPWYRYTTIGGTRWQGSRPNFLLFCKSNHSIFYKRQSGGVRTFLNAKGVGVSPRGIQLQEDGETRIMGRRLSLGMAVGGQLALETACTEQGRVVLFQDFHQGGVFFWKRCCSPSRVLLGSAVAVRWGCEGSYC